MTQRLHLTRTWWSYVWYTCDSEMVSFLVFPCPHLHALDSRPFISLPQGKRMMWQHTEQNQKEKLLWVMLCVIKAPRGLERITACGQSDSEEKGLGTAGFPWKMRNTSLRWVGGEMDENWNSKGQWLLPSSLPLFPQKGTAWGDISYRVWACRTSQTLEWPQSSRELLDMHGLCGQEGGTDASLLGGRLAGTVGIWIDASSKSWSEEHIDPPVPWH